MKMFITSKNKYLSNDMKIFGTCSIPLKLKDVLFDQYRVQTILRKGLSYHHNSSSHRTTNLTVSLYLYGWVLINIFYARAKL